ncbi:twin-arginine translocation signal domain-containing protein [Caenimonas sedimenti]|uniref:Twin-arginine translocation signal domain-containing protein n=1 Tax=Caenimonas sedimenti TaxID=2596921 RepID=A0A562ZUB4_9BURK|nr:twin-arginine translocation signal domain-containing protein [Caenimonas sedimenti]TWO72192.1 twin-arginine translocation signal domain-containing protein [Caenimonas sedimenti]
MSDSQVHQTGNPGPAKASRRGFMIGAAVAGATTATVVGITATPSESETAAAATQPPPERGGGYRLSEHVKQYYKTTLV